MDKYSIAIDELNYMIPMIILEALESTDDPEAQADIVVDNVLSLLIRAYREGAQTVAIMLGVDYEVNSDRMGEVIYLLIEDMTFEDRIRAHMAAENYGLLENLIVSEYHRVFNNAGYDVAESYAKEGGIAYKTWVTAGDERVRDTHDYLEGVTVALDEEFFTYDGDSARFPGDFSDAANNVGCRCTLKYVITP